ncbi:unnamed protein product [Owenia fusiformis]|uniref:Uncharacterized protein n=1 Tax=Owenia fusiformis TaxID=6347 RepID=A0A8J1UKA5_OWEFU|nr:unnamed protein product [Owenia fusiformis]
MEEKPRVLILGGTGFIGRNLVHYLVSNNLTSKIRIVDKVMPPMAWLNKEHKESFSKVEFKHANLINSKAVEKVFEDEGGGFQFVINCAMETKYGQMESVYKEGILQLSMNCARAAAAHKCSRYIEISSGQMFSSSKTAVKEDHKVEPWTNLAKHKRLVEVELETIPDLDYCIVRPAIHYGIGDRRGLTPRLIIGAVYKQIKEKMKMLWTGSLKMNTVHVYDVCRAILHLCHHGNKGEIYHLVDKGDTTQGKISELVSEVFDINHDYVGTAMSSLAKLNFKSVAEDINEKHMMPWSEACQKDGIINTPLNPYLDQELLYDKHIHMDGTKIESTGFCYDRPSLTIDSLKEILDDYVEMGLFPPSLARP